MVHVGQILAELAALSAGMLVVSETDAPLEVFAWPVPATFTPAAVLAVLDQPADTKVEQVALAQWFAPRMREYPDQPAAERALAQRFRDLARWLETHLTDLQVLRIGTIEISTWIVGRTSTGRIIGVTTQQVET
ncbi:MAG: nuclease A inhibitor family protein [Roseiflexaceae bacterium]